MSRTESEGSCDRSLLILSMSGLPVHLLTLYSFLTTGMRLALVVLNTLSRSFLQKPEYDVEPVGEGGWRWVWGSGVGVSFREFFESRVPFNSEASPPSRTPWVRRDVSCVLRFWWGPECGRRVAETTDSGSCVRLPRPEGPRVLPPRRPHARSEPTFGGFLIFRPRRRVADDAGP